MAAIANGEPAAHRAAEKTSLWRGAFGLLALPGLGSDGRTEAWSVRYGWSAEWLAGPGFAWLLGSSRRTVRRGPERGPGTFGWVCISSRD
ncbi:hypothetical protein GCM10027360_47490 [Amycolatopsis echigonensis]